jgi:hypothetical protein
VLEDVHRLGGFGIAAHPDSPKAELQWRDWSLRVDGIEWLNVDSEWRDESRMALSRALLTYWFRPGETLASLLDSPEPHVRALGWSMVSSTIVAVAALTPTRGSLWQGRPTSAEGRSIGVAVLRVVIPGVVAERRARGATRSHASLAQRDASACSPRFERATPTRSWTARRSGELDFHALVDGTPIGMGKSIAGGRPRPARGDPHTASPRSTIVLIRNGRELASVNDGPRLTPDAAARPRHRRPTGSKFASRKRRALRPCHGSSAIRFTSVMPAHTAPHTRSVIHEQPSSAARSVLDHRAVGDIRRTGRI